MRGKRWEGYQRVEFEGESAGKGGLRENWLRG